MRQGERVFVDTGAWIALALTRDPLHPRAREGWVLLHDNGAKLYTSIPIVLETFTFLERNASRDVALEWKQSLDELRGMELLECTLRDLKRSWSFFERPELHKLSAVDATSFTIMKREKLRRAFAFDHHFVMVGFRLVV
jgi:predicted nucleic acid-binding protein